jgi:hypothetical protein
MSSDSRSVGSAVGRALAIVALVMLVLLALAAFELTVRASGGSRVSLSDSALELHAESLQAWLALLSLCIGLFLVFGLWKALRLFYRLVLGPDSPFGKSVSARVIGLAAAALLFPRGVQWLLVTPALVLFDLASALPERIATLLQRVRGQGRSFSVEDAFTRMLDLAQIVASEMTRAVSRVLDGSLSEVLLALAAWMLVSRVIDGAPSQTGLRAWFESLDTARRRLVLLSGVFCIGIFLSMASIVAIPYLQEEKAPVTLTRENLEKALESFKTKPADLEAALPASILNDDPVRALAAAAAASAPEAAASAPPGWRAQGSQVDLLIDLVRARREEAKARAEGLRSSIAAKQSQVVNSALVAFDTEMRQQMSTQERFTFYRQLQGAAQRELSDLLLSLDACRQALEATDRDLERAGRTVLYQFGTPTDAARRDWLIPTLDLFSTGASMYGRACVDRPTARSVFIAPEAGTGWGPFGWVANWLLRTRSSALTLITGMLGFGLLGAAITSFVRAEPMADDDPRGLVGHVVIRGVTAAVLVFLAAKGGLAVFASGAGEPNAYVLFFTCLVGAVFSEDVWTWARARFNARLQGEADARAKGAKPPPAPKPPPPPPGE